ncbi:unnamed protein product [Amoebophrya sp. A120]|nr:unnamed protein product [Amoebophrya sp. A120]|eukprot:GSA120T00005931001.1
MDSFLLGKMTYVAAALGKLLLGTDYLVALISILLSHTDYTSPAVGVVNFAIVRSCI